MLVVAGLILGQVKFFLVLQTFHYIQNR